MGKAKPCTDHLGNKFDSKKEMCKHWDINYTTFLRKEKQGLPLKECLTLSTTTYDHLGNRFNSEKDMCKYWNIPYKAFRYKKIQELPLEKCLEKNKKNKIYDHLGNEFNSKAEMCRYWNVEYRAFIRQQNKKISLKECLKIKKNINIDCFGNKFNSESEMCKYWNIPHTTFVSRKSKKLPLTVSLNIIPLLSILPKRKHIIFRNIEILHFAYKGIDNLLYFNVIIDNQEMILSDKELYERMEAIVIEEFNNGTFKLCN